MTVTSNDDGEKNPVTNWNAVDGATFGDAVDQVSEFYELTTSEAGDVIDRAIEAGELVEDDTGTFPRLRSKGSDDEDSSKEEDEDSRVKQQETFRCLNSILEYYHDQVDEQINHDEAEYETPREYYRDRGWSDETVDEKRLGYAPARHKGELLNRLLTQGYERDVILSTGLLGADDNGCLYSIWNGRYVLPYEDESGDLVFAISRCQTPAHPADWAGKYDKNDTPSKYHKIPTTRDEVLVEEQIYGLNTVEREESVLITEGIADAITAHEHGFECISPVTVQFSNDDMDRLAGLLTGHGVDRVFVVQDVEEPSSNIVETPAGDEEIHIDQFAPGIKGAVKTASRLVEDGVDARVGEVPRLGLEKVDLDDYLTRWDGDLTAVIRSALPPSQHPAWEPVQPSTEQAEEQDQNHGPSVESNGERSALWDLEITDVTGLKQGSRGKNPLGHHTGSKTGSEDYFVVFEESAFDFKYKTAYNALTYLLCEAGSRPADQPGGSLTNKETWIAWRHAKESGYITTDDKCPSAALQHIAVKHDVCGTDEFIDGWKLPRDEYEATLDVVEEEYGIEHGHLVGEQVSTVPLSRIQDLSWSDAKRFARKQGFDWPSTRQARKQLEDSVVHTIAQPSVVV